MQNNFLEFGIRQNIKHAPSVLFGLENVQGNNLSETNPQDTIGGVFRDGLYGWIVVGAHIEIVSLKNGNRIADYTFGDRRYSNTFIAFVNEVHIDEVNTNLLAIGVHCTPTTTCIYLFAVNGSRIVHAIEVEEKLTSCSYIESQICVDSALNAFDGCIIVGAESGKVIVIDLFVDSCARVLNGSEFFNNEPKLCKIVSSISFKSTGAPQYVSDCDDIVYGVHLEDVTASGSVLSILCLTPLLIVAVGFEDGKMLLYDLCTLDAFHIAHPPEDDSPLEKLTFIEPADDPRACVYVWSFHSNSKNAIAVLHSLTYEMKIVKPGGNGFVYKNFERCTPRLTMPIFEKYSKPISCQSITKFIVAEENFLTLCLLSWTSASGAFVCIFDLNQWYKQQLPDTCDWRSSPTFLAIFPLGKQPILDVWMNGATVTPFSSLNRPEEHFYPSSLSFDCTLLTTTGSAKLHWLGLQNEALEKLNQSGPYAILEPNRCFAEMVRASLIPQFTDYSYDINQSLKTKREFLLSIALEYNCVNLLKKCANAWADGSHLSKNPSDGMSLSTLTDWIWNRATSIKECCNEMCVPLFDHSGNSIEPRSQKVLLNFSRQLKRLFQLMDMIVTTHQKYIPGEVLDTLQSQRNSISMATEYQEVLQWLLNMGLLPEVNADHAHKNYSEYRDSSFDDFQAIPYPYETLKNYYTTQRRKFSEINPNFLVPATKSCRILYIDSFIENECNSSVLRSEWRKGFGDGLYPPVSLQAMLRTLLVPGVPTERKYMLFVYLFMDLSTVLREERFSGVIKNLIKFPAVFRMDPGLIKITQAFWNLDHGEFELAIDEIISPLAQDQNMSMWQRELLIGALILNDVPHLALRALNAPGSPISPSLEIRTLLANDLVADAFQVQRMKRNRDLLFEFFQGCHEQRKWHYLLNLSLNEKEEECLGEFLRSIESSLGENIHFIYLLRRCKYLEAVTFIEDLHNKKRSGHLDLDTPNTILSTYRLTMAPSIRQFSDLYYSLKDDINVKLNSKAKHPKPLSTHLSQRRFDLGGGVYHQSLVNTEQTGAVYWENQEKKMCGLAPNNVPFLYGLRVNSSPNNSFDDHVCYPQPFVPSHKRRLNNSLENGASDAPVAKRQRMDCSDVRSTLLTSFRSSAHQSQSFAKNSDDIEIENDAEMLQTTLSTPVVQSHKNVKKSFSLLERVGTPQSILKSRSSYRGKSVSSVASRRSVDSDERSIRFNLPNNKDDTLVLAASTPVVPDVFNFGITQRPSIHSERTPSKLLLNEQTSTTTFQASPTVYTTSPSPGRKRLRSISPEESSNAANCIDVSVEQSIEPQSRQLFVSSEESNDEESENFDQPQNRSITEALVKTGNGQEMFNSRNEDSVGIPVTLDPYGQFSSMKSNFPVQTSTEKRKQPIERIIPIEIEARPHTETQTKCETLLAVGGNTMKHRSSIGLSSFNSSIQMQRNFLTDSSEYNNSSYVGSPSNESLFRPRNLLTSTLNLTGSVLNSTNITEPADDSKNVEQTDIETVQIEDSDDDSPIVCDLSENVENTSKEQSTGKVSADIISVDNDEAYMSSTPFTSKMSQSLQFDASSESFSAQMFRKKNILTDSTVKESPHYNYTAWDRSSMFKPRNVLTDSTVKDESVTSSNRSSLNLARGTIGDIGNSLVSRKGNENNSILIDITDQVYKHSTNPVFNNEYTDDIYDLSSEIDAGLRDDDYDVDDYESDSDNDDDEDDVIDISSGTEDMADNPPIVSKSQKISTGKLSLPPCNTLGRRDHIAELTVSTGEVKNSNPVDESKCSEMSFVTASENSAKHLTSNSIFDETIPSIQPEDKEVLINELVAPVQNDTAEDMDVVAPVQNDLDTAEYISLVAPVERADLNVELEQTQGRVYEIGAEQQIEKCIPSADFIGVVNLDQYDVTELSQNQVTITYELQENLLTGNDINDEVTQYTVEYASHVDFVSSDLNNAIFNPENVDTIEEPLIQSQSISSYTLADVNNLTEGGETLNNAVMESDTIEDTIPAVTESNCEVVEQMNPDITVSEETLTASKEAEASTELTQFVSTTSDLNAGVFLDTVPFQDSVTVTQPTPETEILVGTYEQLVKEITNDNLNEAVLDNQSEMEIVGAVEGETSSKTVDPRTEGNAEVILDIDEILESAVVPDVQKNDEEMVEAEENDVFSQIPSTSVDAIKSSTAEEETKIKDTPKRRLRSNSTDTTIATPTMLTRKRSGSFTPAQSSTTLKSESIPNIPSTPSSSRMTRAKSEVKTPSNDDGAARAARSTRAKSELKTTMSDGEHTALPAVDSMESTSDAIETIPKKLKRTASSRANTPDKNSPATVQITTRVTRSRTRSIAEDDDTASVASEVSIRSTTSRSTRNVRARSHVADDEDEAEAATSKKPTRTKSKLLPVISEDLSQEGEAESQSYADMRRLTRTQKAFMAKAAEMAKKMVPPPPSPVSRKRQRRSSTSAGQDDDDISDTGSVASSKTNASAKSRKSVDHLTPVRQSKRLMEKEGSVDKKSIGSKDSDTESVVSVARSTRSRRSTTSKK